MADPDPRVVEAAAALVRSGKPDKPFVLGICGAQGSGKSTLARALVRSAQADAMPAAALSLDDLYLTRSERERLARDVHPLLRTRGVPGTHDVALGIAVLDALARGEPAALPRFDKACDDRAPGSAWDRAPEGCALLVFEGWCLGARPQRAEDLPAPVNDLEAADDPQARWRRFVNAALAGPYQALFGRVDALVLLAAPGFEVVRGWRMQQEADLRASAASDKSGVMDDAAIARFIAHYERITRHILEEMPARADCVIKLRDDRSPLAIDFRRDE
jgi:D-glycerate 3-kinase